jgi:uncharacterized protein (DUF58 family)
MKLRLPRLAIAVEFTREGWIFVLLSLAIGAAAVNTGNNVLYFIFSLMLGMIVVSGMTSRRLLQGLRPAIQFPDHVFAGVGNICYVSIQNRKKRFPSLGIRFVVREKGFASITRQFFYVPPNDQVSGYARLLFPHRGVFNLRELELQTSLPFSFFLKIRRYFVEHSIRVFPKIYRLSEEVITHFSEGLFRESPYRGESQQLLHIRDYMPLDSSRKIHWKASAKAEKLLVKEYQKEQGRDLYLYFDCFSENVLDPTMEMAISFLASLAFLFKEKEVDARICFPGRTFFPKDSIEPLLVYLAEWDGSSKEDKKVELPPLREAVAIVVRSQKLISRVEKISGARALFIEDWQHLLVDKGILQL